MAKVFQLLVLVHIENDAQRAHCMRNKMNPMLLIFAFNFLVCLGARVLNYKESHCILLGKFVTKLDQDDVRSE